jgi:acetyl-CoA C-acetyltransferase
MCVDALICQVVDQRLLCSAIGTFGGSLKDIPAATLGSVAIEAAVARAKLRSDEVETVVMGNVVQAGTKMNPARQAAVHAGLSVTIPALTVNRVCGSGAQAIVSAAHQSQQISVPVAICEQQQVISIRRVGDQIEVGRVPGSA